MAKPLEYFLMQAVGETPTDPLPRRPLEYYLEHISDVLTVVGDLGGDIDEVKGGLEQEIRDRQAYDQEQDLKLQTLNGHYFPLDAYDFGKSLDVKTPVAGDVLLLNDYAVTMTAGASGVGDILEGTVVKNLFDGVEFVWNSTSQTWQDWGIGNIVTAGNDHLGVVEGVADPGDGSKDGMVTVHPGGLMESIGFSALKNRMGDAEEDIVGKMNRSGDRMTGDLDMNGHIVEAVGQLNVAEIRSVTGIEGDSIGVGGLLDLNGYKVTGVGDPNNDDDAATKEYVDSGLAGKQGNIGAKAGDGNQVLLAPLIEGGAPGVKDVEDFQPVIPVGSDKVLLGPSVVGGNPNTMSLANFDRNTTGSGLYNNSITDLQGVDIEFSEVVLGYASAIGRVRVIKSTSSFGVSKYIEFEFYIFNHTNTLYVRQNYIPVTAWKSSETVKVATYQDSNGKLHMWLPMDKPAGTTIKIEIDAVKSSPSSASRASFDSPPIITFHSDNPYDDAPFKNSLVTITGPQIPIVAGASNVLLGPSTDGGQPGTIPLSDLQRIATATNAGLMSAEDKIRLDETIQQPWGVMYWTPSETQTSTVANTGFPMAGALASSDFADISADGYITFKKAGRYMWYFGRMDMSPGSDDLWVPGIVSPTGGAWASTFGGSPRLKCTEWGIGSLNSPVLIRSPVGGAVRIIWGYCTEVKTWNFINIQACQLILMGSY